MFSKRVKVSQPVVEMIRRIDVDQASLTYPEFHTTVLTIQGVEGLEVVSKAAPGGGYRVVSRWMTEDEKIAVQNAIIRFEVRRKKKLDLEERSAWLKALGVSYE